MPRHHPFAAIMLAAATFLAASARPAQAQSAPAPSPQPPKQKAPAAPAASGAPAQFAVNHGICRDFLALAPDLRGLVVAWTAGRYHKLDRWVMDEATARKVIAGVEAQCEKKRDALFRYQVVAEIDKLK